jgi:hypothetical protein
MMTRVQLRNLQKFILLIALAGIFVASSAQTSKRDGTITGRIVSVDGQPVTEAVITAVAVGELEDTPPSVGCDNDGNFILSGLKRRTYRVSAVLPGYLSQDNSPQGTLHRPGDNVSLTMVKGGVITGRVTDENGKPMEGVRVNLEMIRGLEGQPLPAELFPGDDDDDLRMTDDRGVYRIYGLPPGVYIASVIDTLPNSYISSRFRHDIPVYYPSVKRVSAVEILVRGGEEASGIDIAYHAEQGLTVGGEITGEVDLEAGSFYADVFLINPARGEIEASGAAIGTRRYYIHGIIDGDYQIIAQQIRESGEMYISAQRSISVKGSDLSAIDLKLVRTGVVKGRVVVEPSKAGARCGRPEKILFEEVAFEIKNSESEQEQQKYPQFLHDLIEDDLLLTPNSRGEFTQNNLVGGVYRLVPFLPGSRWYVRAIQNASKGARRSLDIGRNGFLISRGERMTDIEVVIAEGAAEVEGWIAPAKEPETRAETPDWSHWKLHLIPAEAAAADDILRYAETRLRKDGSFALRHLPPGKYYLFLRRLTDWERSGPRDRPLAWGKPERAALRREAIEKNHSIDLQPCQKLSQVFLRAP